MIIIAPGACGCGLLDTRIILDRNLVFLITVLVHGSGHYYLEGANSN